jgi:tRNA A-37 threonylcarbamoyl transferase component Bud32
MAEDPRDPGLGPADFEFLVTAGPAAGTVIPIPGGRVQVGSGDTCQVRISDPSVLPAHAEIARGKDGALWIRDLSGQGETLINGQAITTARMPSGSFVRLGTVELALRPRKASGPYGTAVRSGSGVRMATPATLSGRSRPPTSDPTPGDAQVPETVAGTYVRKTPTGMGMADDGGPTSTKGVVTPGQVIGERYRVVDKLAEGGMGEVYKGEHIELGKTVAIKVMRRELSNDPEFAERFKREAIAATRIGHPNIVDVADFGQTVDGRFYFVMEFLAGKTLTDVLRESGALPAPRALGIMLQMCRALEAAHQLGIVHRDLKPENVMLLDRGGQPDFVKVVDFGVAKVADPSRTGRTSVGLVVGTPQYMSPEQASGLALDARTDIYSAGLMLYEMLAGLPPFVAETPSLIMAAHITREAPPLAPAPNAGDVPESLRGLVMKMLSKAPAGRPPSMAAVISDLELAQAELTGAIAGTRRVLQLNTGMRVASLASSNRRPVLIVSGLAAAVGIGIGAFFFVRGPPDAAPLVVPVPVVVPEPKAELQTKPASATPEQAPPIEEMAKVTVTTTPGDAEVLRDGAFVGRTPAILKWKKGEKAELRIMLKGYLDWKQTVAPEKDLALPITLTKASSAKPKRPKSEGLMDSPY